MSETCLKFKATKARGAWKNSWKNILQLIRWIRNMPIIWLSLKRACYRGNLYRVSPICKNIELSKVSKNVEKSLRPKSKTDRQTLRQRFNSVMDISAWSLPGITVNINAGQRSVMQRKTWSRNAEVSACNVSVSQKLRHQSSLNMWLSMGFLLFDWSNRLLLKSSVCDTSLVKSSLKGGRGEMMLVSDRGVDMSDKGWGKKKIRKSYSSRVQIHIKWEGNEQKNFGLKGGQPRVLHSSVSLMQWEVARLDWWKDF